MSRGGGGVGVGVKKHISPSKTSVYLSTCYTHGMKTQTMVRRSMGRRKMGGEEGEYREYKTIGKMYLVGLKRHPSIILLFNIECTVD